MKTVLLYSGGLDSTVLLYKLKEDKHDVHCFLANYGQRHKKELSFAKRHCSRHSIPFSEVHLQTYAGSSQTSEYIDVPEGHYEDESMKKTVVPNRNMILIANAVALAITQKASQVAIAAHAGDHAIYPDCRPEFLDTMRHATCIATEWTPVDLFFPFWSIDKTEIVRLGDRLGVPFELTWSCYKGLDFHCGKCGTCIERREAFELAGIEDFTVYV